MAADKKTEKASAINIVFVLFVAGAILFAAFNGRMQEVTDASFDTAKSAVNLAIGLIGIMALWLGLVRILEVGGLMHSLAGLVRPIMVRLFPDVPADHPAMSAMLLNISANMLGLGNAATPMGIKAMVELNKLNTVPGTATNAMCLFLAINTSSVTLLPLGAISVRAAAGATDPASIFLPTLIATLLSTLVGITAALVFARMDTDYKNVALNSNIPVAEEKETGSAEVVENKEPDLSNLLGTSTAAGRIAALMMMMLLLIAAVYHCWLAAGTEAGVFGFVTGPLMSFWLMPTLMLLIVAYGLYNGVKIYEAVTDGAKQGFDIAVKIIPYLVAILVAIGMFRASGAMDLLVSLLSPVTSIIAMPAEVLPLALIRPLSGSGAFGIMSAIVEQAPDSYASFVASTMLGCTETTFYVLAVYFGAAGITRVRHALYAGLLADATGIVVTSVVCALLWQAM